jgi:protein ImuA
MAMVESVATLLDLRRAFTSHREAGPRLAFGLPMIDKALGGGLPLGAMHEVQPSRVLDQGAAAGLAGALAALLSKTNDGKQIVWIQHDFDAMEIGSLHGADSFGLPLSSLLIVRVPRVIDVLWGFEEALKCRAVAAVIAEIAEAEAVDLIATRRLSLAARDGGGLGLLLRHRACLAPSAAATRWEVASAPGERDQFGGLGHPAFTLSLIKNRCGPCGRWTIAWDHHERAFLAPALSRRLAQAAHDRPAHTLPARVA